METEATAKLLGHRQTKGAKTDKPNLMSPRHISTLPAHNMPEDEVLSRTAVALAGCQMVELELKLYIQDAFNYIRTSLDGRLPFSFSGSDYVDSSLERLIEVFKKLSDNPELIGRLQKFKKERNHLVHRGLSQLMDYDASEDMFSLNTKDFEERLDWITSEVSMLKGAIRFEASRFLEEPSPPTPGASAA